MRTLLAPCPRVFAATGLALLAQITLIAAPAQAQTAPLRSQFQTQVLVSNLKDPTSITFLPDGRLYLLRKNGTVQIVDPTTGQTTAAGTLATSNLREDGLHSLVLDPAFATNRFIYVLFGTLQPAPALVVARYTTEASGAIDVATRKDLLSVPYSITSADEHNTGTLAFGPDGNLFIGLGDNTRNIFSGTGAGSAPRDPSRPEYDAQRSAANTQDLRGKILRIRPQADGTYSIPEGNLFASGRAKTRPEIFAMGLRHPFRITVDMKTGWLFWAEPGPNATSDNAQIGPRGYEEINLARDPGNYGWPYCLGDNFCNREFNYATATGGAAYDPARLINRSTNNTGLDTLPPARPALVWYPYNATGTAFPVFGSGSTNTAMLGPVYRFDPTRNSTVQLPAYYDGKLFIFDFSRSLVHAVAFDAEGKVGTVERFWDQTTANPILNPIDLKVGPDGALYFLGWGDNGAYPTNASHGNLVRLTYNGPATPVLGSVRPRNDLNSPWALLPPGARWNPPAHVHRAQAYDAQGRLQDDIQPQSQPQNR
jgi:cytochrome c